MYDLQRGRVFLKPCAEIKICVPFFADPLFNSFSTVLSPSAFP